MIYLLDANVLIDANRDYYPISRIPEFWNWIAYQAKQGCIKIPVEIFDELVAGKSDDLVTWIKSEEVKQNLVLSSCATAGVVASVVNSGYANDLSEEEIEKLGRDPFLISYAISSRDPVTIVTTEVSKPSKLRANKKVPDVCNLLGITWMHTFRLVKELNFSTSWNHS